MERGCPRIYHGTKRDMSIQTDQNDLTNQSIAGYSILHRLGVGGMSEVYLAFQESLHRHVALKVMRADFVGSSDHEQRFLQEARAVASLMHPNIVQVYDVGKFESIHYIAQEYVPGSNLHAYIQRRGALPLAESVSILWQATAALQKAASIGLVHRDIKPDNLLLTPDGEVKVADFGLARARGQSQNLTAVGVTLGTPLYMSPEQIQGLTVDSRSDLYSLGATAYHMLSGRTPFSGDTALALAMQHLQADAPSLAQLRPDLPPTLVNIVHRLLSKSPDERYASASELSRALREVVDSHLEGHVDQMVPFAGLIIDNQHVSNLEVTQQLQKLTSHSNSKSNSFLRKYPVVWKIGAVAGSMALGLFWTLYATSTDFLASQSSSTVGVAEQSNVQRQYALALIMNDLKHWRAVAEFFPPKDGVRRNYALKAELQIARLLIEGENYALAAESLRKVIDSQYSDDVLRTIAHIEMGYVANKLPREFDSRDYYDPAARDMKLLSDAPDKIRIIRESLPSRVREEWDRRDYERQDDPQSSKSPKT
jgi:eukaryotic-like serine/threonine-protein kinase